VKLALHSRTALVLLMVSLSGIAGPTECEQVQAELQNAGVAPPPAPATLRLAAVQSYPSGNGYFARLTVQASVGVPLQAFDVDVSFTPGIANLAGATPHPDFNDDGGLVTTGTANTATGLLTQVVDLRHGRTAGVSGSPNLFYVLIRVDSRVPLWVQAAGELARSDGRLFATTPSARVRVLPPPL
jgi:hypothetical protein